MRWFITFCVLLFSLALSAGSVAQEKQAVSAAQSATTAQIAVPATRTNPGDLSAGPVVQASAACCLKQCAGGGNCGKKCKVVDKMSQCASNFSFECPANKGLSCITGHCTCQ